MKKYHIYHIEGIKIGCSDNPKMRVNNQGYTEYIILETYDDIIIASNRELELQKEYGYKVDRRPYWQTVGLCSNAGKIGGKIGGVKNVASGHISAIGKIQGKIQGVKNAAIPGHMAAIAKIQGVKNVASGHMAAMREMAIKSRQIIIEQKDINGNIIKEFISAAEASRVLQLRSSNITQVCKGKRKTAGGYTFNYKIN